ncbi:type IV toxin-antitoxin system AbiEi family antitoxin domain-containing protein [Nocardioides sp. zg-ZUI104]|uniref:type IV toxin-antitoxin system AbiEi family antitoxin domain-containing protein n=1 Tax=Nocardioides faecalis TaxID=2803858 RepID=UPI001BCF2B32|nr:type IV toxin-antitoxin system AbiEi family antitoxin domain-containing protein [Nocardioides faecalis]MBS4752836.1 type IV toxin-antitoxin system AbiEi family antitoxin domain-containing protein [Nocardioides faecalis]
MDPRVTAAIAANDGLITRARALDLGLSPGEVRRLLRHHEWVPLRRGIYTPAETWAELDEHVGRPLLLARAAVLAMRRGWVLSHDSAAHALGMPILAARDGFVHMTRPGWTNAWTENGVKHHLARYTDQQVLRVGGVPVLDRARTAVDIAREHGILAGIVACDSALRAGATRAELEAAYVIMQCWPGVKAARRSVALADPGAQTPHESLGRHLVIEAGIGEPETQFPVRTQRGIAWCDIRVGHHVIETDGRLKYRSLERGGVAHDVEEAVWEEKLRERAVSDRGLVVSRVVWADHWGPRRADAVRRLRSAQAEADARFGRELSPTLAAEAERIRREHSARRPA